MLRAVSNYYQDEFTNERLRLHLDDLAAGRPYQKYLDPDSGGLSGVAEETVVKIEMAESYEVSTDAGLSDVYYDEPDYGEFEILDQYENLRNMETEILADCNLEIGALELNRGEEHNIAGELDILRDKQANALQAIAKLESDMSRIDSVEDILPVKAPTKSTVIKLNLSSKTDTVAVMPKAGPKKS